MHDSTLLHQPSETQNVIIMGEKLSSMGRNLSRQRFGRCPTGNHRLMRPRRSHLVPKLAAILVGALIPVVYGSQSRSAPNNPAVKLPVLIADMRDLILSAVRSANIDDLKAAIDESATKPDLGVDAGADPIVALKKASADGTGLETLAALGDILENQPATLPLGKDLENNLIYVWPYLAERPIETLTPAEQIDLYRLVPAAKVAEMREKKRWLWWRLAISADGSWIMFKKLD